MGVEFLSVKERRLEDTVSAYARVSIERDEAIKSTRRAWFVAYLELILIFVLSGALLVVWLVYVEGR